MARRVPGLIMTVVAAGGAVHAHAAVPDHEVSTSTQLVDIGLNSASDEVIALTADIALEEPVVVDSARVVIDGNGYTLSAASGFVVNANGYAEDGEMVHFRFGGELRNIRLVQRAANTPVVVFEDAGYVHSAYGCGAVVGGFPLIRGDGSSLSVSYSVFEGVSGSGTVIDGSNAELDHVTIVGAATLAVDGSPPGEVVDSAIEPPIPGGFTTLGTVEVNGSEFVTGLPWDCATDARPLEGGALWDAGGDHIGGYVDDGTQTTPFLYWNDGDEDGSPYDADCDDVDGARHPGALEICDGGDQDCDAEVDEAPIEPDSLGSTEIWEDSDGDGWGAGTSEWTCDPKPPADWVTNDEDCDDDTNYDPDNECTDPKTNGDDDDEPGDDDDDVPGDDDDDDVPGDDDDDDVPGDDDDDSPTGDTGSRGLGVAAGGCGCASTGAQGGLLLLLLPFAARRRVRGA